MLDSKEMAKLAASYPSLVNFMYVPGLESFFDGLEGVIDPFALEQRLWATDWWQSHSAEAREWEAFVETDPATAAADIEITVRDLQRQANIAGISMTAAQLNDLAEQARRLRLSDADIQAILSQYITDEGSTTGSISTTVEKLQRDAAGFFLTLSDSQALDYAKSIFSGNLTYDGVINQFRTDATQFFPHFGESLENNLTLHQATTGIRTHIAGMLNLSPEAVDLTAPRFSHLIDYADPDTGERRMKSKTEIDKWARQQEEYRTGVQGMEEGANLTRDFLRVMGKVA